MGPKISKVCHQPEVRKTHGQRETPLGSRGLRGDVRWRTRFLQRLLDTEGDVKAAANSAGIPMVVAYQARADDDDFRADWDRTKGLVDEIRADAIERATADRAVNGSKYQKYTPKGDLIEEGVVPDTPAAVTMLKAYRPARFKERPTEVEGAEVLNSFTALVRAFGDAARARPALQASAPPQLPPESAAPAIEATATVQEAAPPASLIRQVN